MFHAAWYNSKLPCTSTESYHDMKLRLEWPPKLHHLLFTPITAIVLDSVEWFFLTFIACRNNGMFELELMGAVIPHSSHRGWGVCMYMQAES